MIDIKGLSIDVIKKETIYEVYMHTTIDKDVYDIKVDLNKLDGLPQAIGYALMELEEAILNGDNKLSLGDIELEINPVDKIIDKLPEMQGSPEWN